MAAIRKVMVVAVVVLVTCGGLVVPAAAQLQDGERVVHETGAELDYRFRTARFVGRITSSFTHEDPEVPGCLTGRQVRILFRRADGSRRIVGTTSTDETGSFRLHTALRKGVYIARVETTGFVYSPSYGRVVEVVCAAASARMQSTRTRVLGLRLAREATGATAGTEKGRTGRLPFTGWDPSQGVALIPVGVGAIVLGISLLTIAERKPPATGSPTSSLRS